jgi:hypothetical protein
MENMLTWTTRDGTTVRITDMPDTHLMNTIRLIERGHARAIGFYLLSPGPQGEMAKDAFDQEFDDLDEGGPAAFNEKYDPLTEEADKRGLDTREKRQDRQIALDLAVLQLATRVLR